MPRLLRTATNGDLFFKRHPGDPRLGEWIRPTDYPTGQNHFILFGCADDTGVTLNHGRPGARLGPDSIRKHLYKMVGRPEWREEILIADLGNVIVAKDILETHQSVREIAAAISKAGAIPLFMGGGHDFAAPLFIGFSEYSPPPRGLINIDPHLDVRELIEGKPHSGTPFRQILESGSLASLTEFGAMKNRNAEEHFRYCEKHRVRICPFDVTDLRPSKTFRVELQRLVKKCAWVGVTFDMDSCREAEGVSAAPVLGFSAADLVEMATLAGNHPQVNYLEIAEVAPSLEVNERSSRIAAEVLYAFLDSKTSTLLKRVKKIPKTNRNLNKTLKTSK